jgi:hypothetical protein
MHGRRLYAGTRPLMMKIGKHTTILIKNYLVFRKKDKIFSIATFWKQTETKLEAKMCLQLSLTGALRSGIKRMAGAESSTKYH